MNSAVSSTISRCPVCGYHIGIPFFDMDAQPLTTLAWPQSSHEAKGLPRFPLNFVQCPQCTHVYNKSFVYADVPYQKNPNRMFNTGTIWKAHLSQTRHIVQNYVKTISPKVVEIGCGEGHFLRNLAEAMPKGEFLGFDPHSSAESGRGITFEARLFDPMVDIPLLQPDVIIVRHVLEHFLEITPLLESIAWCAAHLDKSCYLFAEVPCIDHAIKEQRTADFYYEHASHFTTLSFHTLMQRMGEIETMAHGYGGEVVYALVKLQSPANTKKRSTRTHSFFTKAQQSVRRIRAQIDEIYASKRKVAIWGGIGKGAAFLNNYGLDAQRFPLVVDSDKDKVGTFVPGTGQLIQYRDVLKRETVDILIIPAYWRTKDILAEMQSAGISVETVLVEYNGSIVPYTECNVSR